MSGDEVKGERLSHSSLLTRHSPLLLFAGLAATFLAPVLFTDRALLPTAYLMRMAPWASATSPAAAGTALPWDPILWDAIAQFYPWRSFTAHWLQQGILPFWDPHQFCGTPFLANSQSAPLYPLHLLLLGCATGLPVARIMAILAWLHLTLAGYLTYLWLRALRLSTFAGVMGGLTFMLSGFAITWLELPSFLTVACWLPLLFMTVHRVLEAPTARRIAAAGIAVGLVLLGGHLQIAFYCLLGVGVYALVLLALRSAGSAHERRPPVRLALALVASMVLGLMLAAPQLLPAVELSRHSHRVAAPSATGYKLYLRNAMPAAQLVRLFMPDFFGNPIRGHYDAGSPADYTEFAAFISGIGLLLGLAGILAWRRRPRATVPAAVIAGLSMALALGTPLNALLYFGLPGFSQSGSPARVLVLFCFAGAWLVGLGVEALTEAQAAARQGAEYSSPSNAGLPPGGAGHKAGPAPPWTWGLTTRWLPVTALTVWLVLLGGALLAASAFVNDHGGAFAPFLARSGPALQLAMVSALLASGVPPGLIRLARTGSISPDLGSTLGRGILALLLLGELWFYGAGFNPTGPLAEVYPSTPAVDALRSGPAAGAGRVLPLNHRWSLADQPNAVLPPNGALALGLSDPQGYDSLFIGRYKGFTNLLVPGRDSAPPENGNMLFLWDPHSPLLPLLAADRLVSEEATQPGASWQPLYEEGRLHVYRYPAALPRAFVARAWRTERDDEELTRDLRTLAATGGLGETALIEGSALGPSSRNPRPSSSQPAVVRDVTSNEVTVTLGSETSPAMLVLLDNHYPGWHASDAVSGAPLPIHRADMTFRGIELVRQTRAVRLRYEPATFRFGLFLALLAIAALTAMAAGTKGVASGAT